MTTNQIAYWNYVENARNHFATEVEMRRANEARERETHRSNLANEAILREKNLLTSMANQENERANKARELETNRSNVTNEKERERVNSQAMYMSELNLQEMIRNNLANNKTNLMMASETARHDLAMEQETAQHNRQTEMLNKFQTITQDKMNVRSTNAQTFGNLSSAGINYAASSERTDVAKSANELTKRSQNLQLLSNLVRTGAEFYQSNINLGKTLIGGR